MKKILFNGTEKESYNKKPIHDLCRIILGSGYIIRNGEIVGYEKAGDRLA